MTKKHVHLIVEKELATDIRNAQTKAFTELDVNLSKNALCNIAIQELVSRINNDEINLEDLLKKYEIVKTKAE